jgi:hypothetical protein
VDEVGNAEAELLWKKEMKLESDTEAISTHVEKHERR